MNNLYFCFSLPALFEQEVVNDKGWDKWFARLMKLELEGKTAFFVERVSCLFAVETGSNYGRWIQFQEKYNGLFLGSDSIQTICQEWILIYQAAVSAEIPEEDIITPINLIELFQKYFGYHLSFKKD